ncbi:MAG: glycoside hydrolase family 9 protein [Candidatus Omnitrophica bacterium]|nr:glycoside hydrolase family 9 protein [Candidatus Omnitrophota bacterium]
MSRKVTGVFTAIAVVVLLSLVLFGFIRFQLISHPDSSSLVEFNPDIPLQAYPAGGVAVRILTSDVVEIMRVSRFKTEGKDLWHPEAEWLKLNKIPAGEFILSVDGQIQTVVQIGYKRRVLSASQKKDDLRIGHFYYLKMNTPFRENDLISISLPENWNASKGLNPIIKKFDSLRVNPLIHISQVGYLPGSVKKAFVGYYLGDMGELIVKRDQPFMILEEGSSRVVFQGMLKPRPDEGWKLSKTPYQHVLEADFSDLDTRGTYRLSIPGLGISHPFRINESVAAVYARSYALGLYHQRCAAALEEPYTRFGHAQCHLAPAEIPQWSIHDKSYMPASMKKVPYGLYSFNRTGQVDVSGGHHDAGDYSKYTINSTALIHYLTFAADVFPHVAELDNLGLPESGDGKSDLLQEAEWEADFLMKMQDDDGGFYFLVYPRDRPYEDDVLPDEGDPQVVFPKTTAATAAASAALAQLGSSPKFKAISPQKAAAYLHAAQRGWGFIEKAVEKYGAQRTYQKITHYGDWQEDKDEIAWAATELFLATGEQRYQKQLIESFDPADPKTQHWQWQRLFEAYGNAVRSYAFAVESGRRNREELDVEFSRKTRQEIILAAHDLVNYSSASAYALSYPFPSKRAQNAGWFFPASEIFDLIPAYLLEPDPAFLKTVFLNLEYESGANPNNISFITGLGLQRPYHIVHQYAANNSRLLPPSGFPVGSLQSDISSAQRYRVLPRMLSYPADDKENGNYPLYDRWSDIPNVTTEFTVPVQARSLSVAAYLMAQSPYARQPWKGETAKISMPDKINAGEQVQVKLDAVELNLQEAQVIWEINGREVVLNGPVYLLTPQERGSQWIEAEAMLEDGRRVFARKSFRVN